MEPVSQTIKPALQLGKIKYINTLPFYHRLSENDGMDYSLFEDFPTNVNAAMREKRIQIAPISSLEYLNNQDRYTLLPGIGIGSRDFSGSVLLISRERIDGLEGATLAITRESLSSSVLLQILLKFKYKFNNKFVLSSEPVEEVLKKHIGGLIIGDQALLFSSKEFYYKYDLSELWWNWTEKPFCFALWAVQKDLAKKDPERVLAFYKHLIKTRDENLMDIEKLIKDSLQMDFVDARFSKIFGYLFNLNYGLDENMIEGLQLYYRLAHRLGLSPKAKPFDFFEVKA